MLNRAQVGINWTVLVVVGFKDLFTSPKTSADHLKINTYFFYGIISVFLLPINNYKAKAVLTISLPKISKTKHFFSFKVAYYLNQVR